MADLKDRARIKLNFDQDDWLIGQEDTAGLGDEFRIKAQYAFSAIKRQNDSMAYAMAASVISAWQADVIANGGALNAYDIPALIGPLANLINSSVWPKLLELATFQGTGILAAQCKLKTSVFASNVPNRVMANTGFVDGDLTQLKGLTGGGNGSGGGTAKELNTGTNFTNYALNWGVGVFETSRFTSNTDGALAGNGSTTSLGYSGVHSSKIDGSGLIEHVHMSDFMWTQTAGNTAYTGYSAYSANSGAKGSSSTTNLMLFSNGGGYYTSASLGGYAAWSPALTSTELQLLKDFFTALSYNIGRIYWKPSDIWIGDSNTVGYNEANVGVHFTDRFSTLVSNALGTPENNVAITGSAMSVTATGGVSTKWAQQPYQSSASSDSRMFIMLGTNDCGDNSDFTILANEYPDFVKKQLQLGYKRENIYLITPPFGKPTAFAGLTSDNLLAVGNIVNNTAKKYGTKFVDLYPATYNAGNGYLQPTNGWSIHLTNGVNGGHAHAAAAILAAVQNG